MYSTVQYSIFNLLGQQAPSASIMSGTTYSGRVSHPASNYGITNIHSEMIKVSPTSRFPSK